LFTMFLIKNIRNRTMKLKLRPALKWCHGRSLFRFSVHMQKVEGVVIIINSLTVNTSPANDLITQRLHTQTRCLAYRTTTREQTFRRYSEWVLVPAKFMSGTKKNNFSPGWYPGPLLVPVRNTNWD
jgi:hypothetical protein